MEAETPYKPRTTQTNPDIADYCRWADTPLAPPSRKRLQPLRPAAPDLPLTAPIASSSIQIHVAVLSPIAPTPSQPIHSLPSHSQPVHSLPRPQLPSPQLPSHPLPVRQRRPSPLALWHLLSLDAPTVAALWTWFLAASVHISLPATSIIAMTIAVWTLYAADRLLDTRLLDTRLLHTLSLDTRPVDASPLDARRLDASPLHPYRSDTGLKSDTGLRPARPLRSRHPHFGPLPTGDFEPRHLFHHRFRSSFLLGILAASVTLAILIPRLDPRTIPLYLILGALLAGYFVLIHVSGSAHRLPKEIAVGLFFAAAVFIPTVGRAPTLRPALLPAAALFALLCSLNCLFIYAWEHAALHPQNATPETSNLRTAPPHLATSLALRHLPAVALTSILAALLLALFDHHLPWQLPTACAAAGTALLLVHPYARHLAPITRRAAADLALLTPVLLLPSFLLPHL